MVVASVGARLCATDSLPHTSLPSLCISLTFSVFLLLVDSVSGYVFVPVYADLKYPFM